MGKSRKHKHVDRNAYRNFGPGAQSRGEAKGFDRRGQVKLKCSPAIAAELPPAVDSAIPLPDFQEALVLLRKPAPIPPDYRSRYPAKKTKRAKWVEPVSLAPPTAEPTAITPIAAPPPLKKLPEAPCSPPPLLLLSYQPVAAPAPKPCFDEPLPTDEEIVLLEPALWIDDVFLAPKRAAAPVFDTPTPEMVRAADTPLPRRAAVTAWRKSGPFDAIGHWLRTRAWQLAVLVAPKTKRKPTELARLRAENTALRRQLRTLEQLRA